MRKARNIFVFQVFLLIMVFGLSGCTVIFQKGRRKDVQQLNALQNEYVKLQDELSQLERAKAELENRLRQEITDREVQVEMGDRGLVITFVAEVLFDSGKAELRNSALEKLSKVSRVLMTTVKNHDVGIEGHTDNVPIKYSSWLDNWELSAARAMSVVRYLINEHGIDPRRLSGRGYGEYRPVSPNDTVEGRQKNRRVEIIILPETVQRPAVVQPQENLK